MCILSFFCIPTCNTYVSHACTGCVWTCTLSLPHSFYLYMVKLVRVAFRPCCLSTIAGQKPYYAINQSVPTKWVVGSVDNSRHFILNYIVKYLFCQSKREISPLSLLSRQQSFFLKSFSAGMTLRRAFHKVHIWKCPIFCPHVSWKIFNISDLLLAWGLDDRLSL